MMEASKKMARRKRLAELIELDGRTYQELVEAIECLDPDGKKKYSIAPSHISEIVNYDKYDDSGKLKYERGLSEKYVEPFSKVLNKDVGYLRGDDEYKAKSYDEYLIIHVDMPYFKEDWNKYERLLDMAGARVINTLYNESNYLLGYFVSKGGKKVYFSEEDMTRYMKRFYEDICEFASKRFDSIMDLGTQESR